MDDHVRKVTELELCCEEGGGINRRTLRRWEARLNKPFPLFRRALRTCFGVTSVAQLGLGATFESARWWTWMTPEEMTEEVDRRQMLGLAANGTVALLLPVPKLTAAAQLLEGRRRIGAGDLATATRVATDIAAAYLATPNTDVVRAAKAQAYTLVDLIGQATMSGDTKTRLAATASDAACLAGSADLRRGRLTEADAWFAEALRLARQGADQRLEALALASSAFPILYGPDPDQAKAVEALEAAAAFHPFLPPAARAYVFAYLAEQHAVLGDDLVSGRFLEHVRAAAALVPHDGPGWG